MHTVNEVGEKGVVGGPGGSGTKVGSHWVRFYEDPSVFLDQLAEFAGSALGSGGACIVIATAECRSGLADRLTEWAIDVRLAARSGRYIAVDAQEMLGRFMVEGWPDRDLFYRTIEPVLAHAESALTRKCGVVSVFGEMVALLWKGGHYDATIQLEQLWNEVATQHCLSLLCAYPLSLFAHDAEQEGFRKVCQQHAEAAPAESFTSMGSESERKRMVSSLQQKTALVCSVMEERERAIAERKHAEEKLFRSEEFARKVVESCTDCVKVLDLEGRLEYMSPSGQAAMEISDLSRFLGRTWLELWKDEDRPRIEEAVAVAKRGGVGMFQADCITISDRRKYWDVRVTPARGRDGAIERLIAFSRDLTELHEAQQIAIQAEKVAAAGRMAATIAHEINNPLEAVTNFIYLARTSPKMPEEAARQLEIADRELTRVAQMAQKTLGFYRDTSKNKWMGVCEVVDDVLLIYERKLRNKQMQTTVDVDPSLKIFVKQGELKQALSNLVANAIDASREGGAIWLRAHASKNWTNDMEPGIRITLADNGSGMAPEVQKRIFAPFFTTKTNVGTGIGLWVTKSLIEQQCGYLRFRSRQGRHSGTVMSMFLPAEPHPQAHQAQLAA